MRNSNFSSKKVGEILYLKTYLFLKHYVFDINHVSFVLKFILSNIVRHEIPLYRKVNFLTNILTCINLNELFGWAAWKVIRK